MTKDLGQSYDLKRILGVAGAAILIVFVGLVFMLQGNEEIAAKEYYEVRVDRKIIGSVEDPEIVEEVIAELISETFEETGKILEIESKIEVEYKVDSDKPESLNIPYFKETLLADNYDYSVNAVAIFVDGQEVTVVENEFAAKSVIAKVEEHYRDILSARDGVSVEELFIEEDITFSETTALPEEIKSEDSALQILLRGTDKVEEYVVKSGDSLWSIASKNNMTEADIKEANPEITDPKRLQIGDTVNLVVPEPYVNVYSRETRVYTQSIPFRTQTVYDNTMWPWEQSTRVAGVNGVREITEEVVRLNGQVVERNVLNEQVLREPTTRVVAQGTKEIPSKGTGAMIWPLQGPITSPYGWRWSSFHSGVDIAATTGTPIKAADSGYVTTAGWRGNYGQTVIIEHGNGVSTLYAHMSSIAVKVGQEVSKGQVIGYVDSTGRSTGPHLHFEVRVNGSTVDPVKYYQSQ